MTSIISYLPLCQVIIHYPPSCPGIIHNSTPVICCIVHFVYPSSHGLERLREIWGLFSVTFLPRLYRKWFSPSQHPTVPHSSTSDTEMCFCVAVSPSVRQNYAEFTYWECWFYASVYVVWSLLSLFWVSHALWINFNHLDLKSNCSMSLRLFFFFSPVARKKLLAFCIMML